MPRLYAATQITITSTLTHKERSFSVSLLCFVSCDKPQTIVSYCTRTIFQLFRHCRYVRKSNIALSSWHIIDIPKCLCDLMNICKFENFLGWVGGQRSDLNHIFIPSLITNVSTIHKLTAAMTVLLKQIQTYIFGLEHSSSPALHFPQTSLSFGWSGSSCEALQHWEVHQPLCLGYLCHYHCSPYLLQTQCLAPRYQSHFLDQLKTTPPDPGQIVETDSTPSRSFVFPRLEQEQHLYHSSGYPSLCHPHCHLLDSFVT